MIHTAVSKVLAFVISLAILLTIANQIKDLVNISSTRNLETAVEIM